MSRSAELQAAKRRTGDLEAGLATVKAASELFDKAGVVRPKDLFGILETMASEGHRTKWTCRIRQWRPRGHSGAVVATESPAIRRAWLGDVITEIHGGPEPPTAGGASEQSSPTPTARR